MRNPPWAYKLGSALLAIAGVAVIITALTASGGNLLANITVRGGTIPALLVITMGVLIAGVGLVGLWWRRRH